MLQMIDLSVAIRREVAAARAKWGDTFELQMLRSSWGDTLDDEEMLAAVIHFQTSGKYLDAFMSRRVAATRGRWQRPCCQTCQETGGYCRSRSVPEGQACYDGGSRWNRN